MAICVIAVVSVAPCQFFSLGANQTTSPGRISSVGPSQHCAQPRPEVTINVCPSGCVCQAVRAPGSNVTFAQATRAGPGAWNSGSMRTVPVNQSSGPFVDAWEPLRFISIPFSQPSTINSQLLRSLRQLRAGLLCDHVLGIPIRPVGVSLAGAFLVLAVSGLRTPKRAREIARRTERRCCGVDPTGKPRCDLLEQPAVAVRIAE